MAYPASSEEALATVPREARAKFSPDSGPYTSNSSRHGSAFPPVSWIVTRTKRACCAGKESAAERRCPSEAGIRAAFPANSSATEQRSASVPTGVAAIAPEAISAGNVIIKPRIKERISVSPVHSSLRIICFQRGQFKSARESAFRHGNRDLKRRPDSHRWTKRLRHGYSFLVPQKTRGPRGRFIKIKTGANGKSRIPP
ncbi:MAG: hypothetical protein BWX80_03377 [Candidatus Hydrogenedentes bacterium ADurb.Bin101]|nr:MAG: hypothetical protein BWX80_03377 [Candidatus Hydrogenedentes bacterium ADurb.Bin101]